MADPDATIEALAARHGFSREAVAALAEALQRGGGRMAQFSHPEFGGMGQWSGGGMLQIGAMFDDALKARVAAVLASLAAADPGRGGGATARPDAPGQDQGLGSVDAAPAGASSPGRAADAWWPAALGRPSASGSQNGLHYAYFPTVRRIAVSRAGTVTVYDTGRHRIFGVSQMQSRGQHLAFTADDGTVDLDRLTVVGGDALTET